MRTHIDSRFAMSRRRYVRELLARRLKEGREEEAGWGIELRELVLPKVASASRIAAAVRKCGARALVIGFPITAELVKFLESSPLPSVGMRFSAVRRGLLMGISYDGDEGIKQSVAMVARILRGEGPATMPIYQHTHYALAVNLRTVAKAGIRVADSILAQAVEVVR